MTNKAKKANKAIKERMDIKITFRLTSSEFKPYEKLIKSSGLKTSEVMRKTVIAKSGKIELPKRQSDEAKRLVFLANKASNNINQLAKRLNQDHRNGKVSDKTYTSILNNLINIERSFSFAIEKC